MVVQETTPTVGDSAELRVDIEVTAEDIAKAKKALAAKGRLRARCCPVAQAINRQLLPGMWASVVVYSAWLHADADAGEGEPEDLCQFDLPVEVASFIRAFDQGFPVEPFTFTLDLA